MLIAPVVPQRVCDWVVWSAFSGESEPAKSYEPASQLVTPPPEPCDLS